MLIIDIIIITIIIIIITIINHHLIIIIIIVIIIIIIFFFFLTSGAHEVGHTLGLSHNFAGSSYISGYASVMDYPPPIITLDDSRTKLVLNHHSYANHIGDFDKVM